MQAVALYAVVEGNYTQDGLEAVGSLNTVLGQLKYSDIMLDFSRDGNGTLLVHGVPPGNVVRVINQQQACNGQMYTVDRLLLPANHTEQIDKNYGDSILVSRIFINGSVCETRVPDYVAGLDGGTAAAAAAWKVAGLDSLLR